MKRLGSLLILIVLVLTSCTNSNSNSLPAVSMYKYIEDSAIEEFVYPACDQETRKWGYIDNSGKWIVLPTLEYSASLGLPDSMNADLLPAMSDDHKKGYINRKGEWVIKPQYTEAYYFSKGIAQVSDGKEYFYIDMKGQKVQINGGFFSEGLALQYAHSEEERESGADEAVGYVDLDGNWVISPQFYISQAIGEQINRYRFSENLAFMELEGKYGYIDKKGNWIIPTRFDDASSFSEGLAAVCLNDKWGFIDDDGKLVIEPIYEDVHSFSEGLAAVCLNGKWGFIDSSGKTVIAHQFDIETGRLGIDYTLLNFHEGLAIARADLDDDSIENANYFGYIDKTGNWVIPPQFSFPSRFINGIAPISVGGEIVKNGYIDKTGKMIISWNYRSDE